MEGAYNVRAWAVGADGVRHESELIWFLVQVKAGYPEGEEKLTEVDLTYVLTTYRHRRRRVHCAGRGVPVLKTTASERRSF